MTAWALTDYVRGADVPSRRHQEIGELTSGLSILTSSSRILPLDFLEGRRSRFMAGI
jgi:hypothetical protein